MTVRETRGFQPGRQFKEVGLSETEEVYIGAQLAPDRVLTLTPRDTLSACLHHQEPDTRIKQDSSLTAAVAEQP